MSAIEAEEHVLGAMLLSARAIDEVAEVLAPTDFYRESYGYIFDAAVELRSQDVPVDAVTIATELGKRGQLDACGGHGKLIELAALTPSASNVKHYADIVHQEAGKRKLLLAGLDIQKIAEEGRADLDQLILQSEEALATAIGMSAVQKAETMETGLDDLLGEIRDAYTSGAAIQGKLTGLDKIDRLLNGLWPGQLIVLAARPGMFKSTLALNIADNIAASAESALFVSLEMSRRELQIRSLARLAQIDSAKISSGMMSEDEAKKLGQSLEAFKRQASYLFIQDDAAITVPRIRAEAVRLTRHHKLSLVVVDYIQLMEGVGDKKVDQVASISRGLKLLARSLNVPVLALSQMNRAIEARKEHRPTLADLRDSGAIEQDADVVMFLHDDANYDTSKAKDGSLELIVAKNRRGKQGAEKLIVSGRYSSFLN